MENGSKFYMVKKKALPEILLKVAEAAGVLITNIKMTFSRFMKRFRERQLPL